MRISLVCPYSFSSPGGVQSHVLSLAAHLSSEGHRVQVLGPVDTVPPSLDKVAIEGVGRSIPVPANKSVSRLALSPFVAGRLRRSLARFRPDVVHVHEPLQAGVSLYTLLLRKRPPIVGSFHAAAERMPFYDWLKPAFLRLLNRVDVKAAVSPAAKELIRRHFGDTVANEIRILPNGINLSRFVPAKDLPSERPCVVLFVGRLESRKGCDVLLDAWRIVSEVLPKCRLVIVGDGPLRPFLESKASRLERVVFKGRVDDTELTREYASARIVCVPAVESESFGIVIVEAMASGACVIASDLEGYKWVGEDAILYFPRGDSVALAEKIKELLSSEEHMDDLAVKGRTRAGRFDWSRLLSDVLEAYSEAAEKYGRQAE